MKFKELDVKYQNILIKELLDVVIDKVEDEEIKDFKEPTNDYLYKCYVDLERDYEVKNGQLIESGDYEDYDTAFSITVGEGYTEVGVEFKNSYEQDEDNAFEPDEDF